MADEAAWRAEEESQFTQEDLTRALGLAASHSLETGIPIPEDAAAMGIVEYMMQTDPEAEGAVIQGLQEFMFGNPANRVGFVTGKDRK
jgi:hypothetical protein